MENPLKFYCSEFTILAIFVIIASMLTDMSCSSVAKGLAVTPNTVRPDVKKEIVVIPNALKFRGELYVKGNIALNHYGNRAEFENGQISDTP